MILGKYRYLQLTTEKFHSTYKFSQGFFFNIIFTCDDVTVTLYILTLNFSQQKLGTGSALKT